LTVYILRHGESLANLHNDLPLQEAYRGMTDEAVPLSQWGREQAVDAGRFLREELAQSDHARRKLKVIHSPFLRTRQTTEGLLEGLGREGLQAEPCDNMREQGFGLFSCITDRRLIARLWPQEHARFAADRQQDKYNAKAPGGESRADVVARAQQLIDTYRQDFEDPNTDVILVGHGLVNRAVEMCLRGLDKEWLRKEPNPTNCAVRKLEGELRHGYTAEYIHSGKERPAHLPSDHKAAPHGCAAVLSR
jgi:2,3-bisphosphoglycerate-dependent phosphoglycerate mutase